MITNDQFNDNITQFNDILETYLESPEPLALLNSEIITQKFSKLLRITTEFKGIILVMIFSFDQFFNAPVFHFQIFYKSFIDGFEHTQQLFDLDQLNLLGDQPPQLSVDNHPILPGTFYYIHPCETVPTIETFIKDSELITNQEDQSSELVVKYLIIWNSVYGTGIFKDLYLKYRK